MTRYSEPAPAKLNLALHVRGKLPDGRHRLETIFAFCTDGDVLTGEPFEDLRLDVGGPFAADLESTAENLVITAARALSRSRGYDFPDGGACLTLDKRLPVASGIGGGSADAAASLRLLTRLWNLNPSHAQAVAAELGSDVPACLLSMTARGDGAGDELSLIADSRIAGTAVLLVNPGTPLATGNVFAQWDGIDRGPLRGWREGRNDLEVPAIAIVPDIADVLEWLRAREGAWFVRMSGSGATCFALFEGEAARDAATAAVPPRWWHLATHLR